MKVLVIRLSSLGDVVLATAAVEALREDRPEIEVHVLTKPAFREVFANHPGVREVIEWDPSEGMLRLAARVRAQRYDCIIDLHRNLRTGTLRRLTPGVRWSRYRNGALRRRLAVWLRRPGLLPGDHVVDRYLAALRPLGVGPRRRLPRVYPSDAASTRVEEVLHRAGWDGQTPLMGLAPGARWATKAWPEERWRELVERLGEETFPVLIGGGDEAELGARILGGRRGANLAGHTSILETAAALALCRVLVTNDSAPLHLATAVGTPVVALFGPTVRGLGFFPLGPKDTLIERDLSCRPCSLHGDPTCPLGHQACLAETSAEEVTAEVRRLWGPIDEAGGE